jgi:integrative and conjugative element protein (TIGR02256 family)
LPGDVRLRRRALVWLAPTALQQMWAEADARGPAETGGMLLGYKTTAPDIDEYVVVEVVGPGPDAVHHTHHFHPDGAWQQRFLEQHYERSGRVTTYLGDWHTHPGSSAAPSSRDQRCARRIARCRSSRNRHPLMVILGGRGTERWQPLAFRYTRARLRQVELRPLRRGRVPDSA